MGRRTIPLGLVSALLLGGALATPAADEPNEPLRTSVMIGQGSAVLREEYRLNFIRPEETLLLDWPPEADPSTLLVGDKNGAVQWLETRWVAPESVSAFDGSLDLTAPGGGVPNRILPGGVSRVECRLLADTPRPRPVEVMYQVTNFSWRAHYDLTIRGDIANQLEPLSLDLEARYYLSNGLSRALSASQVQLRGPERIAPSPSPGPGMLILDPDSPLADRWQPGKPPPDVPQLYGVSDSVTLSAGEVTAVRFASARRIPTERLYVMESDKIPISSTAVWKPLQQQLTFRNETRVGLGFPLPPGTALISTGVGRGSFRQEALLGHTPADGVIHVDLGAAAGVTGSRRSLGRTVAGTGFTEETIELRIANNLPSSIRVELSERPPVPLAWDVVRSSRSYEILARCLRYELEIEPRSEAVVNYTVRLTEPEG